MPGANHPDVIGLAARVDSFERHVYLRGWAHGCTWGAAIVGTSVSIGLVLQFLAR